MIKWGGIRWSVHPLFVLVMLASAATGYFTELIALFAIVLVHELGHVAAAKGFGWTVREVKLLPFGGVAEVEASGSLPAREEAIVAIAGPLQNGWMGAAAWALGHLGWWNGDWADYIWRANMLIGLFNLLPILPLDGGKLMQAALGRLLSFHETLVWSARISIVLSGAMIAFAIAPLFMENGGLQANLLAIGIFLLVVNWTAYRHIPYLFLRFLTGRAAGAGRRMNKGIRARPIVVTKKHTVAAALRLFERDSYHLIVVMEDKERIMAVLPEQTLVNGFLADGRADRAMLELCV